MRNKAMMASITAALVFALAPALRCVASAPAERAHALRKTDPGEATRLFDRALPTLIADLSRFKALRARCWLGVDDAAFLPRFRRDRGSQTRAGSNRHQRSALPRQTRGPQPGGDRLPVGLNPDSPARRKPAEQAALSYRTQVNASTLHIAEQRGARLQCFHDSGIVEV